MIRATSSTPSDIATSMVVYPKSGQDIEALAARIKAEVPGISTMTGKDFDKQIGGATSILNSILVGDRADQPARRRPVGRQHDGDVDRRADPRDRHQARHRREPDADRPRAGDRAALIGFIGGAIGLVLGAIVVTLVNEAGRSSGTVLFELTRRHGHHGRRVLDDPRRPRRASCLPSTPPGSTRSRRCATSDR